MKEHQKQFIAALLLFGVFVLGVAGVAMVGIEAATPVYYEE